MLYILTRLSVILQRLLTDLCAVALNEYTSKMICTYYLQLSISQLPETCQQSQWEYCNKNNLNDHKFCRITSDVLTDLNQFEVFAYILILSTLVTSKKAQHLHPALQTSSLLSSMVSQFLLLKQYAHLQIYV